MTEKCTAIRCNGKGILQRNSVRENGIKYFQYFNRCDKCNSTFESKKSIAMTNNSFNIAKQKAKRI